MLIVLMLKWDRDRWFIVQFYPNRAPNRGVEGQRNSAQMRSQGLAWCGPRNDQLHPTLARKPNYSNKQKDQTWKNNKKTLETSRKSTSVLPRCGERTSAELLVIVIALSITKLRENMIEWYRMIELRTNGWNRIVCSPSTDSEHLPCHRLKRFPRSLTA